VGRDGDAFEPLSTFPVSIHAPRVGRDAVWARLTPRSAGFNSRAPRGARPAPIPERRNQTRFNSRAPRGARPREGGAGHAQKVSIHAPRVGRDSGMTFRTALLMFQFTRPAWGATPLTSEDGVGLTVSIHAPRVGRDRGRRCPPPPGGCFNSRAPRGARLMWSSDGVILILVSIHAPRPGRDFECQRFVEMELVSIHAPRSGTRRAAHPAWFQFTRPARGATADLE